jgi:hypothetical protein
MKAIARGSALVLAGLLFLIPSQTFAHLPGQPPFTYVNGQAAGYYPVAFSSLPDLKLPQDAAPGFYLVNTPLDLKLDTAAMPFFPEEIPFYEFTWDLGDGTTGKGTELTHTYSTTGSKVLTINSRDTRTNDQPQLLSTLFINVTPSTDYKTAQPVLIVNGIHTKDYLTDTVSAAFTKKVMLDASKTTAGSAPIASYTWDLGNRQLAKDAKVTTTYDNLFSSVLPVVRITDQNGVWIDASVQLDNTTLPGPDGKIPNVPSNGTSTAHTWTAAAAAAGILVVLTLTALWLRRRSLSGNSRSR